LSREECTALGSRWLQLHRWREYPCGHQKTRHVDRKGDADRFLDGTRGEPAHGLCVDAVGGRTLLRDYAETWRAELSQRRRLAT
jgi:hypothetical protein